MAQAMVRDLMDYVETDAPPSNRLAQAQERLAMAFERLDAAVEYARQQPGQPPIQEDGALRQQYITLVEDYHGLLQQYETLRSENEQLHTAWHESDQQVGALREKHREVSDRLNLSISQLELLLEE